MNKKQIFALLNLKLYFFIVLFALLLFKSGFALESKTMSSERNGRNVILYVSPNGNDKWSGRLDEVNHGKSDGPFATIERARDEIRHIKGENGLPKEGIIVEILGGIYKLDQPIAFSSEDAGTDISPIVYRARSGDKVIINGGQVIKKWRKVTDLSILKKLETSARGNVFQADIKELGIKEYGDIGLDAAWELQEYLAKADNQGEDWIGDAMASKKYVETTGKSVTPRMEVFFNDTPMEISHWPNVGFAKIEEVLGKTEITTLNVKGCKEGIFIYKGDRPGYWEHENDAYVRGYWFFDWELQSHKIAKISPLDSMKWIISVEQPYHSYGYRKGQWFIGFNMLCELDMPGEWYIDRKTGILYFWPPAPLNQNKVEVSISPGFFVLTDASNITFQGILFEAASGTAVSIKDCRQCRVVGCTFRNIGNHAVTVFNGQQCGVESCDIYNMGGGGIYLIGGDRQTLTHAGHYAENNHIHHYARWNRMYRPGIFMSGVGLRASHNLIHDAPHAAILFGGQENLIEYNEIHNVCQESHDCGAIYAGRSWCLQGNVLQYNYLHHIWGKDGGPCKGVYLDDEFSGATVKGNIFYQVIQAVFLGGGRDNLVENNMFIDCPRAFHLDTRALGWAEYAVEPRLKTARETGLLCGVRFKEPPFSTRYPKLATMLEDEPKKPKGNILQNNIFWMGLGDELKRVSKNNVIEDSWWKHVEPKAFELLKIKDNLINKDPKFVDEKLLNFQLSNDSPAWELGFQRIPVGKIGLYQNDCRTIWPVAHNITPLLQGN